MLADAPEWLGAALTVLFGALAGGVTNRVAIWMLFHPYEPPRVLGRPLGWLQGAMPKNQARLARSIGGAVGGRLLTPEDLAAELRDPELREAFDARIRELLATLVQGEGPSLEELLPAPLLAEVRRSLETLLHDLHGQLMERLESPAFGEQAERVLSDLARALEDEPIAGTLPPARVEEVRARADRWIARLVESEDVERLLRRQLERAAEHVLAPGRTLEELIPVELVAAVEHAINDYLPLAMERLGRLLEDPQARVRVERTVHDLLDRFMRDLKFHQRVVAKLIITEDTVERVLLTLEAEGADRLAELLREPDVQDAMARGVNDAIVEFLRRPTRSVFGTPEDEQVRSGLDAVAGWLVRGAREPGVRAFLLEQAEEAVLKAGERSWGEVARLVPADRVGGWLAAAARSEPGGALYGTAADAFAERVLTRPLGGLSGFLREDLAARLADALAPPAWEWVASQIPRVAARVRIADRVEEKIRDYPLRELEGLVRSVTEHELDLIVRLGYLLGGIIGTILVGVNALIG